MYIYLELELYLSTPQLQIVAHFLIMFYIHKILLLLIFLISTQAAPTYDYTNCTTTVTYTPNSTFQSNLNTLLSNLSSAATQNKGFFNSTAGRDFQNSAYGLYLCRGDDSANVCQDCVTTATKQIVKNCPKEKRAVIWYDECMVRYSDLSFFSKVEERPRIRMANTQNVTEPTRFKKLLEDTMSDLLNKATSNQSDQLVKKFAAESVKFTDLQTLYGLVQCTLDLSTADCNRCLRIAVSNLSAPDFNMDDKQGGRVLMQSCNVRFELYKFYKDPNISPSPSPVPVVLPPTNSKGDGGGSVKLVFIIVPVCVFVVVLVVGFCYLIRKQRKNVEAWTEKTDVDEISTVESLQFDLSTVQAATNNFSASNKIGEGGFGEVFKGVLANGQEIAVKRLSKSSVQGAEEFKNEVVVVAKLQHKSLARLIGFCVQDEEKILIYQYFPNKSLDNILFDPQRQHLLDWSRRYKIIGGIARGMLYLHEDSRLRIIHRDLKASNILLDAEMNAKISDFGMARIFGVDQTQADTSRIVGTYGYMSPEYGMHGHFSVKSDVFSFGVLVLEIVSGKKNSTFFESDRAEDLLSYAWKQWNNNTPLELLDPTIEKSSYSRDEVIRCINIGLLCVQEDVEARPTMASVVTMLTSYSVTMSLPQKPPFFASSYSQGYKSTTTSSSVPISVDQSSITGVYPR